MRVDGRALLTGTVLAVAATVVAVVLVGTGDYPMSPAAVVRTLAGGGDPAQEFVVCQLRLPRALVGLLVGAALGLAGAVFQSVTRNPLGSPDVIGFGYGSAAGALSVIVLFNGGTGAVSVGAMAGGVLTGGAVYLLAWRRGVHSYRLVLVGIGAAAVLSAVDGFLLTEAQLVDASRAMVWLTGSLNGRDWSQLWWLLGAMLGLVPLLLWHGRGLALLELGDDTARALGVPVERTRLVVVIAGVLLTSVATAAAGPVSFVALAAPQLAGRLAGGSGPHLLPAAAMGALLLVAADLAAQQAFGSVELPVGALTGVLGGGYLLSLLAVERRAGRI